MLMLLVDLVYGDLAQANCVGLRSQTIVLFFGLNPANTLKSFQNICLSEDMKNKRLLNPVDSVPMSYWVFHRQRWAPRPEERGHVPSLRFSV